MRENDSEDIIASGAADDAIRFFVENRDGLVFNNIPSAFHSLLLFIDITGDAEIMSYLSSIFSERDMVNGHCSPLCRYTSWPPCMVKRDKSLD